MSWTDEELAAEMDKRVALGAAWLDEQERERPLPDQLPDWWKHVDLDTLKLSHCKRCVFGQLFGGFEEGGKALGLDVWGADDVMLTAHGFNLDGALAENRTWSEEVEGDGYTALTAAWKRYILARRSAYDPQPELVAMVFGGDSDQFDNLPERKP